VPLEDSIAEGGRGKEGVCPAPFQGSPVPCRKHP